MKRLDNVWGILVDGELVFATSTRIAAFEQMVDIAADTYKLPKKYIDGIMISFSKSVDTDTMFGYDRIWAKKVNFV